MAFENRNIATMIMTPNEVTGANARQRFGFAVKSRVGLSPRPGVAEFCVASNAH